MAHHWTAADEALLRRLCAARPPLTDREIGARLGRSDNAVHNRRQRLRLAKGPPPKFWTPERDAAVLAEYPDCPDRKALAARLGCHPVTLRQRARRLGARDRARAAAARERALPPGALPPRALPLEPPLAEQRRLARAGQLLEALSQGPQALRQLLRAGWTEGALRALCAESPDLLTWREMYGHVMLERRAS